MNSRIAAISLIALAVASLHAEGALARSSPSSPSGSPARLDDKAIFDARYTYHFTDQWGVQLSSGYGSTRTTPGLRTPDLDLEWDITRGYEFAGHKLTYPRHTANNGFGAKYLLLDNLFVDLDARYRYFSELVSDHGQGLDTGETTLGLGYRF